MIRDISTDVKNQTISLHSEGCLWMSLATVSGLHQATCRKIIIESNNIKKNELRLKRSSKLRHKLPTAHIITAEKLMIKRYLEKVMIKQRHDDLNWQI